MIDAPGPDDLVLCYHAWRLFQKEPPGEPAALQVARALPLAFLDTETTGLDTETARILEICVCRVDLQGAEDWRCRLVNPEEPIPPDSTRIHGITDAMVADALPFRAIARSLATLLEGHAVVAHNAPYDVAMLKAEFRRAGIEWKPEAVVDTYVLAQRRFKGTRYGLGALAKHLHLPPAQAHRARGDVEMLRGLWKHLSEPEYDLFGQVAA
jgi:DNA polymerase-3 subunit epsilon